VKRVDVGEVVAVAVEGGGERWWQWESGGAEKVEGEVEPEIESRCGVFQRRVMELVEVVPGTSRVKKYVLGVSWIVRGGVEGVDGERGPDVEWCGW
jgi:hypothetical protein